ncbi:unknown [Bifidobacterium adolescentis CAG:119]|nr:unknown [Bifidobacterium adolescentis CAG:119]
MRNACENLEQSDRLLAEKAKRKSFMDHILTIPLDGEDD